MRVGVDANLSFRTADALTALFSDPDNSKSPKFECVGSGSAESDAPWITEFASSGGDAIIGLDKRILSRPHEVKALQEAGLNACFFDFGKAAARLHFVSAGIVHWWPRLEGIWQAEKPPIVLRVKVTTALSWQGLEQLRFEIDGDIPRVHHEAYRDPHG
jgi:hypothetical protein